MTDKDWTQTLSVPLALGPLPLLREDVEYLRDALAVACGRHDGRARAGVLESYRRHWQFGADDEPLPHRKDNAGRSRANTALREFVESRRPGWVWHRTDRRHAVA